MWYSISMKIIHWDIYCIFEIFLLICRKGSFHQYCWHSLHQVSPHYMKCVWSSNEKSWSWILLRGIKFWLVRMVSLGLLPVSWRCLRSTSWTWAWRFAWSLTPVHLMSQSLTRSSSPSSTVISPWTSTSKVRGLESLSQAKGSTISWQAKLELYDQVVYICTYVHASTQ